MADPQGDRDERYLIACLLGAAEAHGLTPAEIRAAAIPEHRKARAVSAWYMRAATPRVPALTWQRISEYLGACPEILEADVGYLMRKGIDAEAKRACFRIGIALCRDILAEGGENAPAADTEPLEVPLEVPLEPGWDPEEDDCQDADPLDFRVWLEEEA